MQLSNPARHIIHSLHSLLTFSWNIPLSITKGVNALGSDLNFEARLAKHEATTARLQSKIPKPHWG